MDRLKSIIENEIISANYFGTLEKPKRMTPYIVWRIVEIYESLLHGGQPEFIEKDIYNILSKCGIKTEQKGIGWIAYE